MRWPIFAGIANGAAYRCTRVERPFALGGQPPLLTKHAKSGFAVSGHTRVILWADVLGVCAVLSTGYYLSNRQQIFAYLEARECVPTGRAWGDFLQHRVYQRAGIKAQSPRRCRRSGPRARLVSGASGKFFLNAEALGPPDLTCRGAWPFRPWRGAGLSHIANDLRAAPFAIVRSLLEGLILGALV